MSKHKFAKLDQMTETELRLEIELNERFAQVTKRDLDIYIAGLPHREQLIMKAQLKQYLADTSLHLRLDHELYFRIKNGDLSALTQSDRKLILALRG